MRTCTVRIVIFTLTTAFASLPGCAFLFPDVQSQLDELGNKGFVGRLADRDALVALLIEGDEVLAYICDGVEGSTSISAWFEGKLDGQQIELSVVVGTTYETTSLGSTLTGAIGENGAEGVLTLEDGTQLPWTAETARADTAGGLYTDGGEEDLNSVIVDNAGELRGLSKSRVTGWTTRVAPTAPLLPTTRLPVQFSDRDGLQVKKEIPLATRLQTLRPILKPKPDPAPPADAETLMIHVALENQKAAGHRYIEKRPDAMGVPTLRLTAQLLDPARPKNVLGAFMRVSVLDTTGKVLSTQFIDDPLSPYVEVPEGTNGEPMAWIDVGRRPASFLVAVPDLKTARKVTFSRFRSNDSPIFAGTIDLQAKSVEKPIRQLKQLARSAVGKTGYDRAADVVFENITGDGPSEDRLDVLFLAEGFQDRQKFRDAIDEIRFHLWSTYALYDELRPLIKIHAAYLRSVDLGAGTEDANGDPAPNDTPFQSYYSCLADVGGQDCRALIITEDGRDFAYDVAAGAAGNYGEGSPDVICVLVNDTRYGGAAAGGGLLFIPLHPDGPDIFAHEFGHAAIGLGDEYETEYNDDLVAATLLRANVDGPLIDGDPSTLKWIDLVHASTPIPTETDPGNCVRASFCQASVLPPSADGTFQTVGMYEGAGYTACESFRPSTSCRMRCKVDYFCAVCEKAFRDTFAPFVPPTIDVYVRDNSLDYGDAPSPSNVADGATGNVVKPWQSPDIVVDAPPFTDPGLVATHVHENPIKGAGDHRVYVTLHNRGTDATAALVQTLLHFAPATGGAPPFPSNWTQIGSQNGSVPGKNGRTTFTFNWTLPADLPPHTCFIALAQNVVDPYPPTIVSLSQWVRGSNNVTWRNVHVVTVPQFDTELGNFDRATNVWIVARIDAQTIPVGSEITVIAHKTQPVLIPNPDALQMTLVSEVSTEFFFRKQNTQQERIQFRVDLPPASASAPFVVPLTIKVQLPGGTPVGQTYQITVSQHEFDPDTGIVGDVIGGNSYEYVSFD